MSKPILVVDDDPDMRSALREAIQRIGHDVILAEDGQDALIKIKNSPVAMVVTDMRMPKVTGLSLLKEIKQRNAALPVLVITGFGTVENAVDTMKEGAFEYLMKPFSFDKLSSTISTMMEKVSITNNIITANPKMEKLLLLAGNVAMSDTTVLIYGESGTGKELLARYIHRMSRRSKMPFVAVNCAAIPDTLMESELFGFEKGAFTGASEKKQGKFELANGGTILLDEIGEMPLGPQAKLLRVLQEKEVDRVGGKMPVPVDVRVIATTNKDLFKESMDGRFREDLYYRLSVFPMQVPPLRERPEDILLLSELFLKRFSSMHGKAIGGFMEEAVEFLQRRQWRGNIRELENTIHRAVVISRGDNIRIDDFMINESVTPVTETPKGIRDMERDMILKTLKDVNGNKTQAAKVLGVTVRTIRNKLNEYRKNFPTV
ncbi:MAG: sigma-54-dependent Fis family transcriptional regulator [Nitrospirae bacterium]|nr:sigma-54-dependent Fis family transcriptional regulator [Nitrospirota bacterium]